MSIFVKYFKRFAFLIVILLILTFFYSANKVALLGIHRTGMMLKVVTVLVFLFGILALIALLYQKTVSKVVTGKLILIILFIGIILNISLFNKLGFQKLPNIRKISDNSMVEYDRVVIYSAYDYPIYFYCNEKFPNAILFADFQKLVEYGISADLLKAWGGIKEIKDTKRFSEIRREDFIKSYDTLSIKGDTVFYADKNLKTSSNDSLFFNASGNNFYITRK